MVFITLIPILIAASEQIQSPSDRAHAHSWWPQYGPHDPPDGLPLSGLNVMSATGKREVEKPSFSFSNEQPMRGSEAARRAGRVILKLLTGIQFGDLAKSAVIGRAAMLACLFALGEPSPAIVQRRAREHSHP